MSNRPLNREILAASYEAYFATVLASPTTHVCERHAAEPQHLDDSHGSARRHLSDAIEELGLAHHPTRCPSSVEERELHMGSELLMSVADSGCRILANQGSAEDDWSPSQLATYLSMTILERWI